MIRGMGSGGRWCLCLCVGALALRFAAGQQAAMNLAVPPAQTPAQPKPESKAPTRPSYGNVKDLPAPFISQPVTMSELGSILEDDKGERDVEVARQLSGFELTERITRTQLKSWEASAPGARSRVALVALADASEFLPPVTDATLPPAPDIDAQRRMIARTVDYLGKILPKLPDFYATRTTVRYEGEEDQMTHAGAPARNSSAWHEVGNSSAVVVYRDGKEVVDPRGSRRRHAQPGGDGLITKGTFGPILSTVIVDAAHSQMQWSRWERGDAGMLAVFRYGVAEKESHYAVAFGGFPIGGNAEQTTGYHGEVAIDPATGTILRLTVQADLPLGSPIERGDILVEYGAVDIGGKMYTCPVRSVSVSRGATALLNGMEMLGLPSLSSKATLLNDVTFEDYHVFRSESKILLGDAPAAAQP